MRRPHRRNPLGLVPALASALLYSACLPSARAAHVVVRAKPGTDVVAPGTGIRSAYWTGEHATWSGTSSAPAFVSGQAALVLGASPHIGQGKARGYVRRTARSVAKQNPGLDEKLGCGLIDMAGAVGSAKGGDH